MGISDFFRRSAASAAQPRPEAARIEPAMPEAESRPRAEATPGTLFNGLDDPALLEYIRGNVAGGLDTPGARSLRNMAIMRCTTLISEAIGTLPLNLIVNGPAKAYATTHPAYRLLKVKPNSWQTPYEFKALLQLHALLHGNGYARIVWSGSGARPLRLIPMEPLAVKPRLNSTWDMVYDYTTPEGNMITLPAREVLHLRDLSLDGIVGLSRIKLAREAIDLAQQAERAASRTFRTGVMAGGAIEVEKELSENAYTRMKESLSSDYTGAENAGKWMLLEEGAKASKWSSTGRESQQIENRNHQIEEVARAFGVPRPLLMMDDTSWGSGIEQLAIFFVQYALSHWFTAWEQALSRSLLSETEADGMQFKFNERALLRGTLKDQADFFAKALGAGGQAPWMTQNEVREVSDMPRSDDENADKLRNPMTQPAKPAEPANPEGKP
ncbi:phage portal protein [Variovorax boronicumulans]|uniref:phage portal protein n=1 Tax=Variovorax boronicumulans TaxID=436515 RepID=UPI001C5938DA